jgi:hypothetical protein
MENLIIEWSENMSKEELEYKNNGFSKTKGSVFTFKQPKLEDLINSFNLIENELSVGAIALCKHVNRNNDNIYPEIKGNKEIKNKIANDFIVDFLSKEIIWKNIHELNNRIIFELRNEVCGMRWYLTDSVELTKNQIKNEENRECNDCYRSLYGESCNCYDDSESESESVHSTKDTIIFRGLLEPYSTYLEAFNLQQL